MLNKSRLQWTSQEDQMLKYLREEEKIQKWSLIALKIKNISNYPRTSKQCRERYISKSKFLGKQEENSQWSQKEEQLIFDLYLKHGPKWTLFVDEFEQRSENSIKNRFYNFIRKSLRKMNQANESRYPYNKKPLKMQSIMVILELSKRIQNESLDLIGYKIDSNNMDLLKIRNQILHSTIAGDDITKEEILAIVDQIHHTNCYLRHLGIFKAKSKKTWKLDKKRLDYIISMQGPSSTLQPKLKEQPAKQQKLEITSIQHVFEEVHQSPNGKYSQLMPLSTISLHEDQDSWIQSFNKQIFECIDEPSAQQLEFDYFQ